MTLVVVKQQDGVALGPSMKPQSNVLQIAPPATPGAELPDPTTLWAWAHTQVVGAIGSTQDLQTALALPGKATSRLICARPLEPGTQYLACIVPTFLAGAQAGLGQTVDASSALTPAWSLSDTQVTLPVYFSWSFTTGEAGDFLTLASLLVGQPAPAGVGERILDLGDLGAETMRIGGALQSPGLIPDPAPAAVRRTLAAAVSGTGKDVRPPMYGSTYTGASVVDAAATGWLAELNVDPAARVAAGVGAAVVRQQQDALVAAAWEQAGDVTSANQLLDRARLAQQVTERVHDRHVSPLPPDVLLQVTAPAHDQTRIDTASTVGAVLRLTSTPPAAAYSFAFTRLAARAPAVRAAAAKALAKAQPASSRAAIAWKLSGVAPEPHDQPDAAAQAEAQIQMALDGRFTAQLLARLDAGTTVPARVLPRVQAQPGPGGSDRFGPAPVVATPDAGTGGSGVVQQAGPTPDPLVHALFAPSFPTPLYSAVAQANPDEILPGAGLIPANSVMLLEASRRFVAALMVGANSEIGRELAWKGFPVDRRATFFQSFWDFRGQQAANSDIPPISGWDGNSALADLVTGAAAGVDLVLVVRAELLRRYPTALVYAVRAVGEPGASHAVHESRRHPAAGVLRRRFRPTCSSSASPSPRMRFAVAQAARGGSSPSRSSRPRPDSASIPGGRPLRDIGDGRAPDASTGRGGRDPCRRPPRGAMNGPATGIGDAPGAVPVALLPVRLETRYLTADDGSNRLLSGSIRSCRSRPTSPR